MVPKERIELSRPCDRWILNPVRLPVPPLRHLKNSCKPGYLLSPQKNRFSLRKNSESETVVSLFLTTANKSLNFPSIASEKSDRIEMTVINTFSKASPAKTRVGNMQSWLRRYFGPPLRELSRSGKILQTLWDAAQLQKQEKESYEQMGRQVAELIRNGQLKNIRLERSLAKIEQVNRILDRLELLLRNYQTRGDIAKVLSEDAEKHKKFLDPV